MLTRIGYIKLAAQAVLVISLLALPASAYDAKDYAVEVSVTAASSPPSIKLQWPVAAHAKQYTIRRKRLQDASWSAPLAVLPAKSIQFLDSNVTLGSAFEYEIEMDTTHPSSNPGPFVKAYSYIYAGVEAVVEDLKGKVILVVDSSVAGALAPELDQFENNLLGAGWQPIRRLVGRTESVVNVRNIIRNEYNADPANVRSVILIGHVPVPYSGLINPDLHAGHLGAWPADVYYGEMDGNWTDNTVWKTDSEQSENNNVPGDGKFDQSQIPSAVELAVGRIDFWNLPAFSPRSEVDLLRNYFRKNHNFRHRQFTLKRQGLVRDNFGDLEGDAPAVDAWRHFPGFFGFAATHEVGAGSFFPALSNDSFLWTYGGGGGGYTKADGVGTTDDFAASDPKTAFLILHGSYFGDWNNWNNFLRAAIATPNYTLASIWSGLPHWYLHHMALGGTVGLSTRITQNNQNNLYKSHLNFSPGQAHISLIGDPTLEMYPVAPVSNVQAVVGTGLMLSWNPSPDPVAGYHVYYSQSAKGPFQRLTAGLATTESFSQRSLASGTHYYMVRPVKLERTGSGTFYNVGQGTTLRVQKDGSTPQLPVLQITMEDNDAREEGLNPGSFRVSRSLVTSAPLVVDLEIGGSAANGVDYNTLGASVTIPAGVGVAFVQVVPKADSLNEGTETVTLSIKPSSTYTLGSPSSATLQIIDHAPNQPPTITAISNLTINEDTTTGPIWFTIGDSQTAPSALSVQASSSNTDLIPPQALQLEGSGDSRTIRITPVANGFGQSTITITVSDGALSATRTFAVTVTAVNDPPVATGQNVSATEDTPKSITLSGTDIDSTALAYVIIANPTLGDLSGTPPALTYTPRANASGADSFTFKVNDGTADSPPATVQIDLQAVNDPPVALAQTVELLEDTPKTITFQGEDVDSTALTFRLASNPTKGILSGTPPTMTYTPLGNITGTDSFTFIANDGSADSPAATVQVIIQPLNDPPAALSQNLEVIEDTPKSITLEAEDIDSTELSFSVVAPPAKGTLSGTPPALIYTPNANATGTDSFAFRANDGLADSVAGIVQIQIQPENDPPLIEELPDLSIAKNNPVGPLPIILSDVDNSLDQLVLKCSSSDSAIIPEENIVLSGTAENRTLSITPGVNATGAAIITLEVTDGEAQTLVQFNLVITNSPPLAVEDRFERVEANLEISITAILANDSDGDLDELTVSAFDAATASGGTVTRQGDKLVYVPPAGLQENDSFTYTITDTSGATSTATIFIQYEPKPYIQSISIQENKDVVLRLVGPASSTFEVAVSSDGTAFSVLGSAQSNSDGTAEFIDLSPPDSQVRIYRVKWDP